MLLELINIVLQFEVEAMEILLAKYLVLVLVLDKLMKLLLLVLILFVIPIEHLLESKKIVIFGLLNMVGYIGELLAEVMGLLRLIWLFFFDLFDSFSMF